MEYGGVPITAALKGAIGGGGLELASSAHVRVADASAYFALPEGQWGLFTGGGATIRVAGLVGKARMIDMMLTGRIFRGQEAIDVGLAQYLVEGSGLDAAISLARRAAENLPLSNFAICSAISHIGNMSALDASYAEAVVAGIVNTQPDARARRPLTLGDLLASFERAFLMTGARAPALGGAGALTANHGRLSQTAHDLLTTSNTQFHGWLGTAAEAPRSARADR